MESAPAGWYPDTSSLPSAPTLRWWDGTGWTAHVAPPAAPAPFVVEPPTTPDGAQLAGWGRRLGAWVIDSLFTGAIGLVATIWIIVSLWRSTIDLIDALDPDTGELPPGVAFSSFYDGFWTMVLIAHAISIVIAMAYHVIFLRWWAATPGKRMLGLRVRRWDADGPLDWATALKRAGLQYGVFALLSVLYIYLLDGLWPLWDDRRQALHDKVASTVVVDVDVRPVDGP